MDTTDWIELNCVLCYTKHTRVDRIAAQKQENDFCSLVCCWLAGWLAVWLESNHCDTTTTTNRTLRWICVSWLCWVESSRAECVCSVSAGGGPMTTTIQSANSFTSNPWARVRRRVYLETPTTTTTTTQILSNPQQHLHYHHPRISLFLQFSWMNLKLLAYYYNYHYH